MLHFEHTAVRKHSFENMTNTQHYEHLVSAEVPAPQDMNLYTRRDKDATERASFHCLSPAFHYLREGLTHACAFGAPPR